MKTLNIASEMLLELEWGYDKPNKSGAYLVIASETDFFNGGIDSPVYAILEYDAEHSEWNTKAYTTIHAWAKLPNIQILNIDCREKGNDAK